jgi:MFS family permease
VGLHGLHNVSYAAFSLVAGWLADRFSKPQVLAGGYFLGAAMAVGIVVMPFTVWTLALVFVAGGIYVGIEETLEDSICAELVEESHHGMAFGVLATVNGVGVFVSSLLVGGLWTAFGTSVAFVFSAVLVLRVGSRERAAGGE